MWQDAAGIAPALAALSAAALPVRIEFKKPAGDIITIEVSGGKQRSRLLAGVDVTTATLRRRMQLQGQILPLGTTLAAWIDISSADADSTRHLIARHDVLLHMCRSAIVPFEVIVCVPKNTSAAEQGWALLNKYRLSLRNMGSEEYALFLHRLGHLHNHARVAAGSADPLPVEGC